MLVVSTVMGDFNHDIRESIRTFSDWARWNMQGRRRDFPVIRRAGELVACPHGTLRANGWSLDYSRVNGPIDMDRDIADLAAKRGVTPVANLSHCPQCRQQ